jgi:hypothetical protein
LLPNAAQGTWRYSALSPVKARIALALDLLAPEPSSASSHQGPVP